MATKWREKEKKTECPWQNLGGLKWRVRWRVYQSLMGLSLGGLNQILALHIWSLLGLSFNFLGLAWGSNSLLCEAQWPEYFCNRQSDHLGLGPALTRAIWVAEPNVHPLTSLQQAQCPIYNFRKPYFLPWNLVLVTYPCNPCNPCKTKMSSDVNIQKYAEPKIIIQAQVQILNWSNKFYKWKKSKLINIPNKNISHLNILIQ